MRFLVVAMLMLGAIAAQADTPARHILVSGSGWVEAVPDMLSFNLTLQKTGQDVEALQREVERAAQQVVTAAREQGIAAEDMDSSRASIRPEYEWRDGKNIYRGQTVQRDIALTLRDLDRYGALLQSLSRLDIQSLGQPRPGHSRLDELQLQALERALDNAATKAARMAKNLEVKLGAVISAEEQMASRPVLPGPRMMAMESADAPDIQFGKQRISAAAIVRYAIND